MHLIWYDSHSRMYCYGHVTEYRNIKSKHDRPECMTILMEFPNGDKSMASKIIKELNHASEEVQLSAI